MVYHMVIPPGLEPRFPPWKGGVLDQLDDGTIKSQVAAWLSLRSDILKYYRQIIYLSNQNNFFSELQDWRSSPARESNPPHFQLRNYPILCFSLGFEHKGNNCFPGCPGGVRTHNPAVNSRVLYHWATGQYFLIYFASLRRKLVLLTILQNRPRN